MKFAKADPGVDPRKQLTLIIIWTVFNLLACIGFVALFVSGLLSRRLRRNRVLLSLYAVFVIATAAGPLLTWTGHVMNTEVPIGLCIVSGAFGSSWSLAQVASTLALVLKIWSHALMINKPRSTVLRWIASSPLLVALPWALSLPFFFAAIGMGAMHNEMVTRGSPLYCSFNLDAMNMTMLILTGICEIGAVSLAAWTASLIARTRWRTRALRTNDSGDTSYFPLTIRTLIFVVLLTIVFSATMSTTTSNFNATTPDIINSICDFIAVFVFGSDPHILRIVFRCAPDVTPQASHAAVSITLTQQTHIQRDVNREAREPFELESIGDVARRTAPGEWKGVVVTSADEYALPARKIEEEEDFSEDDKSRHDSRA